MSPVTFQATHTSAHQDAERALRRLVRTLDAAMSHESVRSELRDRHTVVKNQAARKLRAIDAQTSSTAAQWARDATEQVNDLHDSYPAIDADLQRRKAARQASRRAQQLRDAPPRQRLGLLLNERRDELADQKTRADGADKQALGTEYNRVENYLHTLDRMGKKKINELLRALSDADQ